MTRTRLNSRSRVKLAQEERSALVAARVGRAIKASPHPETVAMRLLADRILAVRDDLADRTGGKNRTWSRVRRLKDSGGRVVSEEELPREQRLKSVAATVGAMLAAERRLTPTWVLDAIEEGVSYLPWRVGP